MKAHWTDELVKMDACAEAVEWARTQPSLALAWRVCPRGDWMLWLAEKRHVDRKRLTWGACQCARTALRYVPDGEARPPRGLGGTGGGGGGGEGSCGPKAADVGGVPVCADGAAIRAGW